MNIKEATLHIKNTVCSYFEKDENGEYLIPVAKQRPVFLYGPPGIGKTAVMEQIARELDIGIVSYSMTHHTRQSAIGLPFITRKKFGDCEYDVSEYTMSEILASVYEYIESTGKTRGILFLDEINCVSETLAPSMLRFLQYKSFGCHTVPDGWVVVTAGNPPEYNKSVREYDIATLDRIKKIDVDADYGVWREYAVNRLIHPAILAYLDIKKTDFYIIESTTNGKNFVTARGWEDLSQTMRVFEQKKFDIDITLIEQYIHHPTVAADFADCYATFKALRDNYSPVDIANGNFDESCKEELRKSEPAVKLGLINLLSSYIAEKAAETLRKNSEFKENAVLLKSNRKSNLEIQDTLKSDAVSLKADITNVQTSLSNTTNFIDSVFGISPEESIFVSNIVTNKHTASFLMNFGCEKFEKISKVI